MPTVSVNSIAILTASVVTMIMGSIWYAKPVFGKIWMAGIGKTEDDLKKGTGSAMTVSFVCALITGYVLSHFIDYAAADSFGEGMTVGFWIWLGFVGTVIAVNALFTQTSKTVMAINAGYQLVSLLLMAGILAAWS